MHLFCVMRENWLLADKYVSIMKIKVMKYSTSPLVFFSYLHVPRPWYQVSIKMKISQSKTVNAYVPLNSDIGSTARSVSHLPAAESWAPASTAPSRAWALHRATAPAGAKALGDTAIATHSAGARASAKAEIRNALCQKFLLLWKWNTFPMRPYRKRVNSPWFIGEVRY